MPMPSSMCMKSSVAIIPVAWPVPQYGQPPMPPMVPSSLNVWAEVRARMAAYADDRAMPRALWRCR